MMNRDTTSGWGRGGYDRRLLAHKVRWEGGVLNTLAYGIRSEEIGDEELAASWAEVERLYRELMPKVSDLERALGAAA